MPPVSLRISRRISEKFETVLMEYSGARGKLIHEKNQKQTISCHCPFKGKFDQGHNIQGTLCPMDAISKKTVGDVLTLHRLNIIYAEAPNKVLFSTKIYIFVQQVSCCILIYTVKKFISHDRLENLSPFFCCRN
jgi:hypothetical protein